MRAVFVGQVLLVALCMAKASLASPGAVFQTSIAPQADEDLASACRYEITLLDPSRTIRGVWVIFDRGRDMLRFYGDPDVQAFARDHSLALMFPFHCPAKSGADGDLNMDPSRGIGRAFFAALAQFAEMSKHPELASAKMSLLGFSGTGSLAGRFAEYAPDRVSAVIASHPGHNPLGMDTIDLSTRAAAVPQLILVGSADRITGTERPYDYFRKYFDAGAPWTFIVQNRTPHCCVINAKGLVLRWLDAVVVQRLTRVSGWYGFIRTSPSDVDECGERSSPAPPIWCGGSKDAWRGANWSISAAQIGRRATVPAGMMPSGWLPTREFAGQWRSFVSEAEHPIMSLP